MEQRLPLFSLAIEVTLLHTVVDDNAPFIHCRSLMAENKVATRC